VTSKSIEKDDESSENYSLKSQAEVSKPFASNFRQVGVIKPFSRDRSYHPFVGSSTNQSVTQSTTSASASASVSVSKEKRKEEKKVVISRNKEEEKPISLSPIKNEEKEKKLNEIVDTDKSLFPVASSTKLEEKSFEKISEKMADKKVTVAVETAPAAQIVPVFTSRAAAVRPTQEKSAESNLRDVKLKHVLTTTAATTTTTTTTQQQSSKDDKSDTRNVESKPPILLKSRPTVGRKTDAQPNSMVFNFVNSTKVVTHIENDGLDMSKRRSKSNSVRIIFRGTFWLTYDDTNRSVYFY
jgi:hypothetical protein